MCKWPCCEGRDKWEGRLLVGGERWGRGAFVSSFRCRFAFRPFMLYLCSGKGSARALPFFRFPSP